MIATLPNCLTFLRIFFIPLILATFFWDVPGARWLRASVFIIACMTDFLDGYFARMWSQTTRLGQFLDPMADKLLIASILLFLAGFQCLTQLDLIPACIILCREILVSGLRETLGILKKTLPVTSATKWKTAIRMLALTLLLIGAPHGSECWIHWGGEILLWISGILTFVTGLRYLGKSWKWLGREDLHDAY